MATAAVGARSTHDRNGASPTPHGFVPLVAFSSLSFPVYACQMPLTVYMPAIYAQQFGVPLALLGTIFLIEKLWGAFADPLVGSLSDHTRTRFGRRRPFIVAGAILFVLSGVILFLPPNPFPPLLLGAALFIFYLALSMMQIPYFAWSGELSDDYHERTRIVTYQTVAAALSVLGILLVPTLIEQTRPDNAALKLGSMGLMLGIGSLLALVFTLRSIEEPALPVKKSARQPLSQVIAVVLRDGLLMRVLLSDFAVSLGQYIRGTLIVFFVTSYMNLPQWASGLFLLQFVFGVAAGPIWNAVSRSIGKHRAAIAGELAQVAINLGLLLVVPGQLTLLLALTIAQGLAQGSGNQMLRAMVADVADKHRLDTGHDRTALFFSVFSISIKAAMAVAVGIALPLVAWFGFDPATPHNSPAALRGLLLVFTLGPAIAHLASAALLRGFQLDEATHAGIRRALATSPVGDDSSTRTDQRKIPNFEE